MFNFFRMRKNTCIICYIENQTKKILIIFNHSAKRCILKERALWLYSSPDEIFEILQVNFYINGM